MTEERLTALPETPASPATAGSAALQDSAKGANPVPVGDGRAGFRR